MKWECASGQLTGIVCIIVPGCEHMSITILIVISFEARLRGRRHPIFVCRRNVLPSAICYIACTAFGCLASTELSRLGSCENALKYNAYLPDRIKDEEV